MSNVRTIKATATALQRAGADCIVNQYREAMRANGITSLPAIDRRFSPVRSLIRIRIPHLSELQRQDLSRLGFLSKGTLLPGLNPTRPSLILYVNARGDLCDALGVPFAPDGRPLQFNLKLKAAPAGPGTYSVKTMTECQKLTINKTIKAYVEYKDVGVLSRNILKSCNPKTGIITLRLGLIDHVRKAALKRLGLWNLGDLGIDALRLHIDRAGRFVMQNGAQSIHKQPAFMAEPEPTKAEPEPTKAEAHANVHQPGFDFGAEIAQAAHAHACILLDGSQNQDRVSIVFSFGHSVKRGPRRLIDFASGPQGAVINWSLGSGVATMGYSHLDARIVYLQAALIDHVAAAEPETRDDMIAHLQAVQLSA